MRSYINSDIFTHMNSGNNITRQIQTAMSKLSASIINNKIQDTLDLVYKANRDSVTLKAINAIKAGRILILYLPIDSRFPANLPYVKVKGSGNLKVAIDVSKYATVEYDDDDNITKVSIDVDKLYNLIIPALIALDVLNDTTVIAVEPTKQLAKLWAKMFCHILKTQRFFVSDAERYEAFMYFAMRFFMLYYMDVNINIVDRISNEYIGNSKSKYIMTIEERCKQKNIDLYSNWENFARYMFSNEITNIKVSTTVMTVEEYIRLFCNYLGRDGAYIALWSADLFFFCIFNTFNGSWILNDRAWATIIEDDPKAVPKIESSLFREL